MNKRSRKPEALSTWLIFATLAGVVYGCAPRVAYRAPARPPARANAPLPPPPAAPPEPERPPRIEVPVPKPLPQEPRIREQSLPAPSRSARILKDAPPPAPSIANEGTPPILPPGISKDALLPSAPAITAEPEPPVPLPDDSSLLAKITARTQPQRAASLRLVEEGRKLVDAGAPGKGLPRLEQSIAIDSSNPYAYFYLAKAHHKLGRYRESLNFLDVAESRLSSEPYWLAEVHALRGENFRALGMGERADASYTKALSINPGNHTATDAMSRPQTIPAAGVR
jgi:hypothetical protein